MKWFSRLVDRITLALAVVAGACLIAVAVGISIDVVLRNFAGHGIAVIIPLAETLLVCIVFLAMPETQRRLGHVAIDLVWDRLSDRGRRMTNRFGCVVVIAALVPIVWVAVELALTSFLTGEFKIGIERTPVWPMRASIVVGLVFTLLQLFVQLWRPSTEHNDKQEFDDESGTRPNTPSKEIDGVGDRSELFCKPHQAVLRIPDDFSVKIKGVVGNG
jgi:TRAP-type C4-dicarboxylate transport system permease small subunit